MEKKPTVSVIIPTYNREHLLPRAIKSVLEQTFSDFEIIVVDDASTDNTKKIIEDFQKKDKRIKYIKHKKNKGESEARNTGIKNCRGKYIAFLDSDDRWLPLKLEEQLKHFKKPNVKLVTCWAFIIDEHSNKKNIYKTPFYKKPLPKILEKNYILSSPSSVIIKKEIIKDISFFDSRIKFGEDWDYWIKIIKKGYNFFVVRKPLLEYFFHQIGANNLLSFKKKAEDFLIILENHREVFLNNPKIYARHLRSIGHLFCFAKEMNRARKFFWLSFWGGNYKSLINLFLSFGGSALYRNFFEIIDKRIKKYDKGFNCD